MRVQQGSRADSRLIERRIRPGRKYGTLTRHVSLDVGEDGLKLEQMLRY